jgi:hypothetical protein
MLKKTFKQQIRITLKQNGLERLYLEREYYENAEEKNSCLKKIGLSPIDITKCYNSVIASKIDKLHKHRCK